ncbi:MAG: hypothetical protein EZS28_046915, partial [Streblomastix strix]
PQFDEEDTEWRGETKERDIFEQKKIGSKGSDILDWRVRVVVEMGEHQIVKVRKCILEVISDVADYWKEFFEKIKKEEKELKDQNEQKDIENIEDGKKKKKDYIQCPSSKLDLKLNDCKNSISMIIKKKQSLEKRNLLESYVFEKQTTLTTQEKVLVGVAYDEIQYDYAVEQLKKMIEWMKQVEDLERDLMKQKLKADEERKDVGTGYDKKLRIV